MLQSGPGFKAVKNSSFGNKQKTLIKLANAKQKIDLLKQTLKVVAYPLSNEPKRISYTIGYNPNKALIIIKINFEYSLYRSPDRIRMVAIAFNF